VCRRVEWRAGHVQEWREGRHGGHGGPDLLHPHASFLSGRRLRRRHR
jgi:hypothetical protein